METTEEVEQRFNSLSKRLKEAQTHQDFQKLRQELHGFITKNPDYRDRILELFLEVVGPKKSNTSTESL